MSGEVRVCSVSGCGKPIPSTMGEFGDSPLKWTHVGPEGEAVYREGNYYCLNCWDMKNQIARDGVVVHLETELLNGGHAG